MTHTVTSTALPVRSLSRVKTPEDIYCSIYSMAIKSKPHIKITHVITIRGLGRCLDVFLILITLSVFMLQISAYYYQPGINRSIHYIIQIDAVKGNYSDYSAKVKFGLSHTPFVLLLRFCGVV